MGPLALLLVVTGLPAPDPTDVAPVVDVDPPPGLLGARLPAPDPGDAVDPLPPPDAAPDPVAQARQDAATDDERRLSSFVVLATTGAGLSAGVCAGSLGWVFFSCAGNTDAAFASLLGFPVVGAVASSSMGGLVTSGLDGAAVAGLTTLAGAVVLGGAGAASGALIGAAAGENSWDKDEVIVTGAWLGGLAGAAVGVCGGALTGAVLVAGDE